MAKILAPPMSSMKLLVIDDDDVDRMMIVRTLRKFDLTIDLSEAKDADDGLKMLTEGVYDAVLLDYSLPGCNGLEFLQKLETEEIEKTAVLVVTQHEDDKVAEACINAGAQDFILKSDVNPRVLLRSIRHAKQRAEYRYEILKANEELRVAKENEQAANRHKSLFLAGVSHELRTPLNSIIGFTNILLRKTEDKLAEKEYDALKMVQRSGKHLLRLIEEILDMSKIESGRVPLSHEDFSLSKVIVQQTEAIRTSAEEKGLSLTVTVPEDEVFVTSDEKRCIQILNNLSSNAVKYTHDGSIEIRLEHHTHPAIGACLCISVSDTGMGMSQQEQEEVFFEFSRGEQGKTQDIEGTGLGLFITHKLVKLLGADISLDSEEGVGSTFRVYLSANRD